MVEDVGSRSVRPWKIATIILAILCFILASTFIAYLLHEKFQLDKHILPVCISNGAGSVINDKEPENPPVFHDLTLSEFKGLQKYLYNVKSLNLQKPDKAKENTSFIYLTELFLPSKDEVLRYLDEGTAQPPREAKVTIFRGDKSVPDVEEYIVGPLPVPTGYRKVPGRQSIPYRYRPNIGLEYNEIIEELTNDIHAELEELLFKTYGAKLKDCNDKCLHFWYTSPFPTSVSGEETRKIWFWMSYKIEYYTLQPVDFAVLVHSDKGIYSIDRIWFNAETFDSLSSLALQYKHGRMNLKKREFPSKQTRMFSKAKHRGQPPFEKPLRSPLQVEPDGKRYSLSGRQVKYMNWQFNFRMSSAYGPQVYDIRFLNERIIYELGLQEITVFYSAHNPFTMFADFFDSYDLIGPRVKTLVPGSDCPEHSTFVSVSHLLEYSETPLTIKKGFCIFELNTGEPLRRHHEYGPFGDGFYEGLENVALVLRTIITVVNYDYVIDFVFYQNGAMRVKVMSTGYIVASFYTDQESKYGFQIHDNIIGNLHQHLFHFKVDLDIKGPLNRFETLDIELENVANSWSKNQSARYHQTKFKRNLKHTEQQAAYNYNFDAPKYLLFYNNSDLNKYGNPRSYRVLIKGMSKQLLPRGVENEPSASWSRYQMAVTKRKEDEPFSSSLYALLDAMDPVVQFERFLEDDESIVDQDLVAWIAIGLHHIPHTEDIPMTTTPGMDVSFYLLPFNYFHEDPSISSRNAIRIEPKNDSNPNSGAHIERYGVPEDVDCVPTKSAYKMEIEDDMSIVLDPE